LGSKHWTSESVQIIGHLLLLWELPLTMPRKVFSECYWASTGTDCPEGMWNLHSKLNSALSGLT